MVNTKVVVGKLSLKNPVMTASGTFGFGSEMARVLDLGRLGACVVKSTSKEARVGNATPRVVETSSGILNAIGLQNGGVENFINEKLPFLRTVDTPIVVNIVGNDVSEYVYLAQRLSDVEGVDALEINISCPNVKHGCDFSVDANLTSELVSEVRKVTALTLITKLSPNVTDIVSIGRAAVEAGSDALSLINTLVGTAIDAKKRKFRLANITGGLSGPAIKPVALRLVWQVHQALPSVPLIGMGGISSATDAIEFLLAGATAVAVGTSTFVTPTSVIEIIDGIEDYMTTYGVADVNELIGAVTR